MLVCLIKWLQPIVLKCMAHFIRAVTKEALPGKGGSHVARLNFKTSCVAVYKCFSLIVGFGVTVAIWQREVVSCRDFILCAVATFWAMSLVGIYPGRASLRTGHQRGKWNIKNVLQQLFNFPPTTGSIYLATWNLNASPVLAYTDVQNFIQERLTSCRHVYLFCIIFSFSLEFDFEQFIVNTISVGFSYLTVAIWLVFRGT